MRHSGGDSLEARQIEDEEARGAWNETPRSREVVFLDTADFRLYNNAFILRQRITYEFGFPAGEPEIVFKFRHQDMNKAAALDVRPNIAGNYRIKFKAEALPLKDQVGGYRMLFSHNAEFPLSQAPEGDRESMGTLARGVPGPGDSEVLQDGQGRIGQPDDCRGSAW